MIKIPLFRMRTLLPDEMKEKKQPDRPTNAQMLKPLYLIDKVSCDQRNENGTTKW